MQTIEIILLLIIITNIWVLLLYYIMRVYSKMSNSRWYGDYPFTQIKEEKQIVN